MRRGSPEVALGAVLVDGEFETPHGVLGRLVAVHLEGIDVCVGGIVRLFEVVDLDVGGLFEGLACFAVCGGSGEGICQLRGPEAKGEGSVGREGKIREGLT